MGNFSFETLGVPGMLLVKPKVHGDNRGYFMETYQKQEFCAAGICSDFVQDNESRSICGVLRGLHFQKQQPQAKLVRVTRGRVFDVGVDVRPGSPYFGQWAAVELNDENKWQLYVPQGFAHGFLVLSDMAEFTYKCTDYYAPQDEGGVLWNDPDIGIQWPKLDAPVLLSEKDSALPGLAEQDFSFFERWL